MTRSPLRAIRVGANIRNLFECCIVMGRLFCKSHVIFLISAPKPSEFDAFIAIGKGLSVAKTLLDTELNLILIIKVKYGISSYFSIS